MKAKTYFYQIKHDKVEQKLVEAETMSYSNIEQFSDKKLYHVISSLFVHLGFSSPEVAEALGLRCAIAITLDMGFSQVMFASDCLSLVNRLKTSESDRSWVGIKFMVAGFSSASFYHVKRSMNEAAHLLARSCDVSSVGFIFDSAPDYIRRHSVMMLFNKKRSFCPCTAYMIHPNLHFFEQFVLRFDVIN